MKITLEALSKDKHRIDRLIIRALEQSLYIAFVEIEGERFLVGDKKRTTVSWTSQLHAKKPFKGLGITETVLELSTPYDEIFPYEGEAPGPTYIPIQNPDQDIS